MRIITGALPSSTGAPESPSRPRRCAAKPPPQNSLIRTIFDAGMPIRCASCDRACARRSRGRVEIERPVLPMPSRCAIPSAGARSTARRMSVDDERGVLEAGLEVAERPFVRRLPIGRLPSGTLASPDRSTSASAVSDAAAAARAGCAGGAETTRCLQPPVRLRGAGSDRIDDERQRLEIDVDALDASAAVSRRRRRPRGSVRPDRAARW